MSECVTGDDIARRLRSRADRLLLLSDALNVCAENEPRLAPIVAMFLGHSGDLERAAKDIEAENRIVIERSVRDEL
jgi:hypothetical protein